LALYLTGSSSVNSSRSNSGIKLNEIYSKTELGEMELDESREKDSLKIHHNFSKINTDWDSLSGQFNNIGANALDTWFSAIGLNLSKKLGVDPGLVSSASVLITKALHEFFPNIMVDQNFSMMDMSGRLLRSPLHILDGIFSSGGELLSKSPLANLGTIMLTAFGLSKAEKGKDLNELHYHNLHGTISRSLLHQFASLSASSAQKLTNKMPLISVLLGLCLPMSKAIKNFDMPWDKLETVLGQNLFHFSDALYSSIAHKLISPLKKNLGATVALSTAGLVGLNNLSTIKKSLNLEKIFETKILNNNFHGRVQRSIWNFAENIAFALGDRISNSSLGSIISPLYLLFAFNSTQSKSVELNTIEGFTQRLGYDFANSLLSGFSNKISGLIPAPILAAVGPSLANLIGSKLKDRSCAFNTSDGLRLRNFTHFFDNLVTTSVYKTANKIFELGKKKIEPALTGSILSDGRWLRPDGRIVSNMALGKNLT
jgi:hypothetical protein